MIAVTITDAATCTVAAPATGRERWVRQRHRLRHGC